MWRKPQRVYQAYDFMSCIMYINTNYISNDGPNLFTFRESLKITRLLRFVHLTNSNNYVTKTFAADWAWNIENHLHFARTMTSTDWKLDIKTQLRSSPPRPRLVLPRLHLIAAAGLYDVVCMVPRFNHSLPTGLSSSWDERERERGGEGEGERWKEREGGGRDGKREGGRRREKERARGRGPCLERMQCGVWPVNKDSVYNTYIQSRIYILFSKQALVRDRWRRPVPTRHTD